GPVMRRILATHGRLLGWTINRPRALAAGALALVILGYFAYGALGSNLLPAMDEGSFILDYIMPAGSSLKTTSKVLDHVEQILRETPEVDVTTRRTGLQLGLAAVTEA